MKKIAVFVILKHNDELLLLKRFKEPFKDHYTPVGGKLEPYEIPHETAIRETFEETGIQLSTITFMGTLFEVSPVDYNWISFVYVADIPYQPAPVSNEGILEWIPKDNLGTLKTPETDAHIYQKIFEGKNFAYNAKYDENLVLLSLTDELNPL